jgi:hypothetical protein
MKNRLTQKTPKFFRILRNIGITLTGIAAALLGQNQVELPAIVSTIAEHAAVTGTIISIVSQATVLEEPENKEIKTK